MEQSDILNAHFWRLLLLVEADCMRAVALNTADSTGGCMLAVPFNPTAATPLAAVEEAVYAVPWLTAEFGRVDIVADTLQYTLAPARLGEEAAIDAARFCCLAADDDTDTILTDTVRGTGAMVAWAYNSELLHFFARTFRNPSVRCSITPLLEYFAGKNAGGNAATVYAHIGAGSPAMLTVAVFGRNGALRLCTSRTIAAVPDAAYWILAAAGTAGIDRSADTFFICGNTSMRPALMSLMAPYAAHVLPFIYPSAAMRPGIETHLAPLPLVLIPLCE